LGQIFTDQKVAQKWAKHFLAQKVSTSLEPQSQSRPDPVSSRRGGHQWPIRVGTEIRIRKNDPDPRRQIRNSCTGSTDPGSRVRARAKDRRAASYFILKLLALCTYFKRTRGQCYDHNFLQFFPIFGEKIGVFLKNQCYDQNFA
jgi:hypothetical protein